MSLVDEENSEKVLPPEAGVEGTERARVGKGTFFRTSKSSKGEDLEFLCLFFPAPVDEGEPE